MNEEETIRTRNGGVPAKGCVSLANFPRRLFVKMIRHSAKVFFTQTLAKVIGFTEKVEEVLLGACIAALWMLLFANVIARELRLTIFFAEELYHFFRIVICFVAFSYGARKARHLRMAAFFDLMKEKIKKVLILIQVFVAALLSFFMAYLGLLYTLEAQLRGHLTPSLQLPYFSFLVIIPVGLCLGGIHYVRTFIKNILEKEVWLSPERKSEYQVE